MFSSKKEAAKEPTMDDLKATIKSKDAEIAYLEAQVKKKDDEILKMKAQKEMASMDNSRGGSDQYTIESIKRYESVIESLNKKIQYLENQSSDGANLDFIVYHRFNQNLKDRFLFIERVLDWNNFAADITENKVGFRNNWKNKDGNPHLHDEANSKQHFAAQKSTLHEILEDVYYPLIDPQEHENLYSRHDMALKQQHSKMIDSIVIELCALTQVLHGLNDQSLPAESHIEDKSGKTVLPSPKTKRADAQNHETSSTSKGDLYARPNISHNQTMIIAGLMKRLIGQIPVKLPGGVSSVGKNKDFGSQVTNLMILLKKRTSLRDVYHNTLHVDLSQTDSNVESLVDSYMNLVLDYDAHCEREEQEVPVRKEEQELQTYNRIQAKLNNKVSNIMRSKDTLKLIAKGIKPLVQGGQMNGGSYRQMDSDGYNSPNNTGKR